VKLKYPPLRRFLDPCNHMGCGTVFLPMHDYYALAYASAIAMLTTALAFAALWRTLRDPLWAHFTFTCLAASLLYALDGHSLPVGDKPNLAAASIGLLMACVILVGTSRHMGLSQKANQVTGALQAGTALTVIGLVAAGTLTRIQVFEGYALMFTTQATASLWLLDRAQRWRFAPVLLTLALYPVIVWAFWLTQTNPIFLRYITGLIAFLVCTALMVEAMLSSNSQSRAALEDLSEARVQLESVVGAMAEGSTQVAEAGESVSQSAQLLAMRTDQQTASLKEISETVHSVVGQVNHTADNVTAVDAQCENLREQARQGNVVVTDAVDAIKLIDQRAH